MVFGCGKVNSNVPKSTNPTIDDPFVNKTPSQKLEILQNLVKEYENTPLDSRKETIRNQVKNLFHSYDNKAKNLQDVEVRAAAHQFLCKIKDKEALQIAKQAKATIEGLNAIRLYDGPYYRPVVVGDGIYFDEPPARELIDEIESWVRPTIKDALLITGRYKPALIFKNWGFNLAPALNTLQKEYKIPGGLRGEIFGENTRNALIDELKKFVIPEDN